MADGPSPTEMEQKVEEIAGRYLDLLKAGAAPHPDALAAAYPEIGDRLKERLAEVLRAQEEQSLTLATPPPGALDADEKTTTKDTLASDPRGRAGESTVGVDTPGHPEMVGPYKILESLGAGGMGAVYLAEQTAPVRRRVALKLIKLGMDTKEVVARFESERQALALMDHPNIARVFDAGSTETGRPYFVMERVQGIPITDYCDRHRLSTPERLELFQQVCDGVQHAHQKGIIHRDLKPSNILVTVPSGKPVAKIIDFGIAKATHQKLVEQTFFTQQGRLIGTPEYMSPEQAEATSLDVDTRTDIYSLGVVLYRLLTGALPFDSKELRAAGYDEIRRKIREEEPPKPSTRLSTTGKETNRIAEARHTDAATLGRLLRGDLDWITMKALEKDRTRRYSTASELAADIQRHLDDEPVVASPPSTIYRLRKFAKKNREPIAAIVAILAVMIAGLVVSISQRMEAKAAKREAVEQRDEAKKAKKEAEEQRETALEAKAQAEAQRDAADRAREAEQQHREIAEAAEENAQSERDRARKEAAKAEAVSHFLRGMLASVDPAEEGRDVKVADLLEQASRRIDTALPNEPLVEAAIRDTIGTTYRALGRFDSAEPHLEAALELLREVLGEDHPETLKALSNLAVLQEEQGKLEGLERVYRRVLDGRRKTLGDDHLDTLSSMGNLALLLATEGRLDEAEPLLRQALETSRKALGDDHLHTLKAINNLAGVLKQQGRTGEAEPLYREVIQARLGLQGEEHPEMLITINNLAVLLDSGGRQAEAEPLHRKVLKVRRRVLGDEHPDTLVSLDNLGKVLKDQGKLAEAEPLQREVLEIRRRTLGDDHPGTLTSLNNLAVTLREAGKLTETEPLFRDSLRACRRIYGKDHPETLVALNNLAVLLEDLGKLDQAEPMLREALKTARRLVGDDHPFTLVTMNNLALLLEDLGKVSDAKGMHLEVLEARRRLLGGEHPQTLTTMNNLGALLRDQGELEEAERLLAQAVKTAARTLPDGDVRTGLFRSTYGDCLTKMERYEEAEEELRRSLAALSGTLGPTHKRSQQVVERLVTLYEAWGKPEKAKEVRALLDTPDDSTPGK